MKDKFQLELDEILVKLAIIRELLKQLRIITGLDEQQASEGRKVSR